MIRLMIDFENPGHLENWMKTMGFFQEEIETVLRVVGDWQNRPGPVVLGIRLWNKTFYQPTDYHGLVEKFLNKRISFSELKAAIRD